MSIDVQPSSPAVPGTLICHTDYAPDGVVTAVTVTRADEWIQVSREFAAQLRDEGQLGVTPGLLTVGKPSKIRYRFIRPFDQYSDLYQRVTRLPGEPLRTTSVEPKHGMLCTMDGDRCRSPHCRVCGGVADAQGFCPTCPREDGPHADGFRLVPRKPLSADRARQLLQATAAAVESPDRPHAAQEAAAEQQRQLPIAAEVRQLLAGVESITTEQLTEHLQREGELATRVDELQATLSEVLGHFTRKGHPGEPCLRTGWLPVKWVDRWRRIAAGRPSWDQLFALIDVELTPWQQDILADGWSYRETHGKWPMWASLPGERRAGHKTLQAAASQLLERARAAGWAE